MGDGGTRLAEGDENESAPGNKSPFGGGGVKPKEPESNGLDGNSDRGDRSKLGKRDRCSGVSSTTETGSGGCASALEVPLENRGKNAKTNP